MSAGGQAMTPQDAGLEGKRILVTGAARGLGRATSLWMAAMGADVIAADLQDCSETAADGGGRVTPLRIDLADVASSCRILDGIGAEKPVYGLVNAAAILLRRPLAELSEEDMAKQIAVNQTGAFFLARACLSQMIAAGQGGRIVMFTSQGAFSGGYHGSVTYSMTKAAVTALVKALARDGAPHGVTVNAIAPGAADTPMLRDDMTPEALAAFQASIPMGRVAKPEEIAAPAAFLLSHWGAYITGTTLHVNGGQYMP
jgi:NAD(P)-dependent dehydrogenase (short-subunit alcohol dehydrogenase family)